MAATQMHHCDVPGCAAKYKEKENAELCSSLPVEELQIFKNDIYIDRGDGFRFVLQVTKVYLIRVANMNRTPVRHEIRCKFRIVACSGDPGDTSYFKDKLPRMQPRGTLKQSQILQFERATMDLALDY